MLVFERLRIWSDAADLVEACHEVARRMPRGEGYPLADQVRRAAISVAVNIAEGKGRGSMGEFRRFLWIAHGSLTEVQALIVLARRMDFAEAAAADAILKSCVQSGRSINALQRTMKERAPSAATHRRDPAP